MSDPASSATTGRSPAGTSGPSPVAVEEGWRLDRSRVGWFAIALVLLAAFCLWFCWLQPPGPVGKPPAFPSLAWLWQPREESAQFRLPRVPRLDLNACFFTNQLGWAVGDQGLILRTANGGRDWQVQSNIVWGVDDGRMKGAEKSYTADESQVAQSKAPAAPEAKAQSQDSPEQAAIKPGGILKQVAAASRSVEIGSKGASPSPPTVSGRSLVTAPALLSICFVDRDRGWIVGDGGTILHTEDGGETWTPQRSGAPSVLRGVSFADAQHGCVVAGDGLILRTADGGANWTARRPGSADKLLSVTMVDSRQGWAVGWNGTVLHTADGGANWTRQVSGTSQDLYSVAFVDAQHGWAVGDAGAILHTADGGKSWTEQSGEPGETLTATVFADQRRGWAFGDEGTILSTTDGGQTWGSQRSGTHATLFGAWFNDPRRGWAVGETGTILHTSDGGRTWQAQATAGELLKSVAFTDVRRGWVVGENGTVLSTKDGGGTWVDQSVGRSNDLNSVSFVDAQRGWVGGGQRVIGDPKAGFSDVSLILETEDGGRTWAAPPAPVGDSVQVRSIARTEGVRGCAVGDGGLMMVTDLDGRAWGSAKAGSGDLLSVTFADPRHGWAVGDGVISHTADGGLTWTNLSVGLPESLGSVAFADPQNGWVAGRGVILHTGDGGQTWAPQSPGTTEQLNSMVFADARQGWVVGTRGVILHTADGGTTWTNQVSGTTDDLYSVVFAGEQHVWVAGDGGTILRTTNGGMSWENARRYQRHPAPLFYPSLGLVGFVAWWGLRQRPKPIQEALTSRHSIADHAVSDSPLTSRDFDAMNFGALAEGIASFLRNEKTTGPLTLAVTGEWGTGKSSIMGLVKENLEAHGWRPVWFNAWHHEQEEQLLAALLESIRSQAVPPWLSPAGLGFRVRLIWQRLRRQWVQALVGAAFLAALVAVVTRLGPAWEAWGRSLVETSVLGLVGKVLVALGGLAAALKALQGLQAFGMDASKLVASVASKARLGDLGVATSLRHRFAREFGEVTSALQPRTMTVFVDDLDRCEPPQVMQVMRALNFLSSSGECFLIVGMEEKAVTNCVAVSLSQQVDVEAGRELEARERAQRRWDYARLWMEKLIQIRVPVPSPDDHQFKALLRGARGYPAFRPEEIRRPEAFVLRLRGVGNPCLAYLWRELCTPEMQRWREQPAPRETGPDWLRRPLAERLTRLVDGPGLYQAERFAGVVLRPATRALLERHPEGEARRVLNRLLLEDALMPELRAPFVEWLQQWAARVWRRASPFMLVGAILAGMAGAYFGVRAILPAKPERKPPPPLWETNGVVAPEGLTDIRLESPQGLPGALLLTNANLTNWLSTQQWNVRLQFEPGPRQARGAPAASAPGMTNVVPEPPEGTNRPARTNAVPLHVEPGQPASRPAWEIALSLGILGVLFVFGLRRLVELLNRQVQDSEDFRAALDRWSRRISLGHKTPRAAKRLVNKLRFYAMMIRALRTTGVALEVPENAIVAFGVLEEESRDGAVRPEALQVEDELAADVADLQTALTQHGALFNYLSRTFKGAAGPGAPS